VRDQYHDQARDLFARAEDRRAALVTTTLVLAEVHRQLLFRTGPRSTRQEVLQCLGEAGRTGPRLPEPLAVRPAGGP
jgi:predicted nucleic acid-binding protein